MPIQLEKRPEPSKRALLLAPFLAVAAAVIGLALVLSVLGKPAGPALHAYFLSPFSSFSTFGEVLLKFGPLLLIAQGLAIGFRSQVWNIGAEGQMIIGAVFASSLPILWNESESALILPAMVLLGVTGGALWAGIAAFLRVRFNASEILVTLMMNAIALQILFYLVLGPWKDPMGFNFPQSVLFQDAALFPVIIAGTRVNLSLIFPLIFTLLAWLLVSRSYEGFRLNVSGEAPDAARYAGFSGSRAVWLSLIIGGGAAGLAGMAEVAGPIGQLQRSITSGYGYSAIIVAFLGGLNPFGIALAAFLLAVVQIGGSTAMVAADVPYSAVRVFQGLLLVFSLIAFSFVTYRIRPLRRAAS